MNIGKKKVGQMPLIKSAVSVGIGSNKDNLSRKDGERHQPLK